MNRLLYWIAVALLLAAAIWTAVRPLPDPKFDQARLLQSRLAQLPDQDADERRESMTHDLRNLMDDLTQEQRREIWNAMRLDREEREFRAMERFFTLPEEQQNEELDRRIDEQEVRRLAYLAEHQDEQPDEEQSTDKSGDDSEETASEDSAADQREDGYRLRFHDGRESGWPSSWHNTSDQELTPREKLRWEFRQRIHERRTERGLPPYFPFRYSR